MGDVLDFIDFLVWIFPWGFYVTGVLTGIVGTAILGPVLYRFQRRVILRRRWRRDRPMQYTDGLFPEWGPYEPEAVGVDKRCICHNRKIHPGERVLTWPETGPMDVLHLAVYCETSKERLTNG